MSTCEHDGAGDKSIFTRKFSTNQVATLTGIPVPTLHSYMKRGFIVGQRKRGEITGGGKRGQRMWFSWYNLVEVAVAAAILRASNGGEPKAAFDAAIRFAHTGTGGGQVDDGPMNWEYPRRVPSLPFHPRHGRTLFCVAGDRRFTIAVKSKGPDQIATILSRLRFPDGFIVVDASRLVMRLADAIGGNFEALMKQAYPEDENSSPAAQPSARSAEAAAPGRQRTGTEKPASGQAAPIKATSDDDG